MNAELIDKFYSELDERSKQTLDTAIEKVIAAKKRGGKFVVVTGSGPNIHEGVTTLIAELINKGIVDGVTTSSAVVNHEMGGTLDRVKMCPASQFGFEEERMPRGNVFEFTDMTDEQLEELSKEMILDKKLLAKRLSEAKKRLKKQKKFKKKSKMFHQEYCSLTFLTEKNAEKFSQKI